MAEVIHGLVSGLIWSAILGTCLIAIAAVLTATVPVSERVRSTEQESTRDREASPVPTAARFGRAAILHATRPRSERFAVLSSVDVTDPQCG
jgi:hypothetical protein